MFELLNTVICYNNYLEVVNYAIELSELECSNKIILSVVVNKLENIDVVELESKLKTIDIASFVVIPEHNLGYLNGMLEGYKEYIRKYDTSGLKYIIMSNTDINYPDKSILKKILNTEYDESVWCIGPSVFAPGRSNFDNPISEKRRSKKEVERIIKRFKTPLYNELYFHLSNVKGKFIKKSRGESRKVYEVHGCYFIVTKQLCDLMVESPFRAFLYSEEAYVAEMNWHHGKTSFYDANLIVEHIEHTVTGKIDYKKLSKYIAESMEIVLQDFY